MSAETDPLNDYNPTPLTAADEVEVQGEQAHDLDPTENSTDPYDDVPYFDDVEAAMPEGDMPEAPVPDAPYDDVPPDEQAQPSRPKGRNGAQRVTKGPPGTEAQRDAMAAQVVETIQQCLAAMHKRPGADAVEMVAYILSSEAALAYLDDERRAHMRRLGEVITSVAATVMDEDLDLFDIPYLAAAHPRVAGEVAMIRAFISSRELPKNPTATWRALCEQVQRLSARSSLKQLEEGLDLDLTAEELMERFRKLVPPTSRTTELNSRTAKTAMQWQLDKREADAARPPYRIASGFYTYDWAVTAKNPDGTEAEPIGCWAPGEFHVIAAPTGNGKSAFTRRVIAAATEDIVVNWGHSRSKTVLAFTEESADIVNSAAYLNEGDPFHHLANNIVLADIGASRRSFIHAVWDCVIEAYHTSKETGLPIIDSGLPELIIVDYIGGMQEGGESETQAMEMSANLCMRGLAAWRIESMEGFSGESFSSYAGMAWPAGMDNFKPAVVALAQFRKLEGIQFWDPENSSCVMSNFVMENADGTPGWPVQPGDFMVPPQAAVRGSGVLINHATSLTTLHRSRPQKNPTVVGEDGRRRLTDNRARFLLVKTRNGADMPFIPMLFDSNSKGNRGQFYDQIGEKMIALGDVTPGPGYREAGDPILPIRPAQSPFAGVTY